MPGICFYSREMLVFFSWFSISLLSFVLNSLCTSFDVLLYRTSECGRMFWRLTTRLLQLSFDGGPEGKDCTIFRPIAASDFEGGDDSIGNFFTLDISAPATVAETAAEADASSPVTVSAEAIAASSSPQTSLSKASRPAKKVEKISAKSIRNLVVPQETALLVKVRTCKKRTLISQHVSLNLRISFGCKLIRN